MACAARSSERICGLPARDTARLVDLLAQARLPVAPPRIAVERWLELMHRDKKVQSGALRFILLERLGHAVVRGDVDDEDVAASVN